MATANPTSEDNFVLELNKVKGNVVTKFRKISRMSEIDYKSKTQSIISSCDTGTRNEQLNNPCGVTVDHSTDNIYVADHFNNCVKVFDSTAKYLFKFGDETGEGKMSSSWGLHTICGNKVLVTQWNHCIQVYQLDGKFVSRIGNRGNGQLQFILPSGLSTDEYNGDIYICDSGNHRIQILSENFQYKSEFGKDILSYPCDIKLYKDNIFVLNQSNPCLHIYNKDLVLQKSVVTRGREQQVINPYFFFIDKFGSILISDYSFNSILILNSEFEFIHKISVSDNPFGITMNNEGRVIVVCSADKNCLQIF